MPSNLLGIFFGSDLKIIFETRPDSIFSNFLDDKIRKIKAEWKNKFFQNLKFPIFRKVQNFKFPKFRFFPKCLFLRRWNDARVGRWRVGFLSVTVLESNKYSKHFKIPQNHKTKKLRQLRKSSPAGRPGLSPPHPLIQPPSSWRWCVTLFRQLIDACPVPCALFHEGTLCSNPMGHRICLASFL